MQQAIVIVRHILLALVAAFVAYRMGSGLIAKGYSRWELVDYMVILPIGLMALVLVASCIHSLLPKRKGGTPDVPPRYRSFLFRSRRPD